MTVGVKKLKKGDMIQVMSGTERGKQAKILHVHQASGRVSLENVFTLKKHRRPRKQGEKGEIVTMARFISAAKLQLICPRCKKPTRVGFSVQDGKKRRVCRKCKGDIS